MGRFITGWRPARGRYYPALTLFLFMLLIAPKIYGQKVKLSLDLKKASIEEAFQAIQRQSSYRFFYSKKNLQGTLPITLQVNQLGIDAVLVEVFRNQPLRFEIQNQSISVRPKSETPTKTEPNAKPGADSLIVLSGRVVSAVDGTPLPGATVKVVGTEVGVSTDADGYFRHLSVSFNNNVNVSYVGFHPKELRLPRDLDGSRFLTIALDRKEAALDETIVIGYGTTNKRYNTGSVFKVSSEVIESQPVNNPVAALSGRVPGMIVSQSSGVPGSSFRVQIRGRNSILQGSEPLYIIDGIPFSNANSDFLGQIASAAGNPGALNKDQKAGLSPFNLINPSDILSIEVLKDADATAIYGSRGANGVILITTKKGKQGKLSFNVNLMQGTSFRNDNLRFLNTEEYVMMRKEAYANDGLQPSAVPGSATFAPDITLWDTTRYTDLKKLLTGKHANFTNVQASVSGGSATTRFLLSAGYRNETTVFPGDLNNRQLNLHSNITHRSDDGRFNASFSTILSGSRTNITSSDLSSFLLLAPNLPALYGKDGELVWEENGNSFDNPLSYLARTNVANSEQTLNNLNLSYTLLKGLQLKLNAGYNSIKTDELAKIPQAALDPQKGVLGLATIANSISKSWILEPQVAYNFSVSKGKFDVLAGASLQSNDYSSNYIMASNYTNDDLLGSLTGAGSILATNEKRQYRYGAIFGRLNYTLKNRYIVNITGRRDGSSRFGPGRQYANFGAVGAAWIFTNEPIFSGSQSYFNFGKIRASIGSTGNDQIGDYQYLDAWTPVTYPYADGKGIKPIRLYNPNYGWEVNKKIEAAIETGFLDSRILFTTSFFRNRSNNQLINYNLPIQTGFSSVIKNFNAVVQNQGWEFTLSTQNIRTKDFDWKTDFNLTRHRNKLIAFPELSTSSYAYSYVVGESLSVLQGYKLKSVDPETGIYQFEDLDDDGKILFPSDYAVFGNLDPKYYGGILNSIRYKALTIDIFFEFRSQLGRGYLSSISSTLVPGGAFNQPAEVMQRWQRKGDVSPVQKFTSRSGTPAYNASNRFFAASNGVYSKASFLRAKNVNISYDLASILPPKAGFTQARIFFQGQNLFVITGYEGGDPETQNIYQLPPLTTVTLGLNFTL